MFGRMLSGESIFVNEYTAQGGAGMIAFASSFPGSIIPYRVTPGNGIIVQKRGFLAMEKGLDLSMYFQKKLGRGFFGGVYVRRPEQPRRYAHVLRRTSQLL